MIGWNTLKDDVGVWFRWRRAQSQPGSDLVSRTGRNKPRYPPVTALHLLQSSAGFRVWGFGATKELPLQMVLNHHLIGIACRKWRIGSNNGGETGAEFCSEGSWSSSRGLHSSQRRKTWIAWSFAGVHGARWPWSYPLCFLLHFDFV